MKFDPNVTPEAAEAVLTHLSPPEEGSILAGKDAVIIRACCEFVDFASREEWVVLINAVRTTQWEPSRHQVPAKHE